MKIKAFSFEQNSFALASVKQSVASQVNESGIYFDSFADPNALFAEISSALNSCDVILLGIENSLFLKFKPVLIKAFNFTPAYSEKIDKQIGSKITDPKLRKAHTLVPNECAELVSPDGLFSGFYVKAQEQYIVVFPLSEDIVPGILTASDLPFFKAVSNAAAIEANEKADTKAGSIVAKLLKNDIKLAIPATPASKLLKEEIKGCSNYENTVYFTPFVNDEGISDPKEYAAQLAKGAMDLRSTELGATVSNIFREKKGDVVTNYYSFISVATADKIVVKKLFANADENVDNLVAEATAELYAMLDKYIDETIFKKNATEEEKAKYEQALIEAEYQADSRPTASIGKKGTIIAIAVLAVAVVVCVILGFKFGGYFVTPNDAPEQDSIQAGNTVATTAPETTLPQIPANTDALDESTSEESSTSIFDIPSTTILVPIPETNNPVINYRPNTNTGSNTTTEEPTTKEETTKEETTKEETTTEKETTTKFEQVEI